MNASITPVSLLTLIFITLKLIGSIAWSWWWVLAPLWLPALVTLLIVMIALVASGLIDWTRDTSWTR